MDMKEDFSDFSNKDKLDKTDYYMSPEGFMIFTEKYHLKRGYCCKSSCKHCPYAYDEKTDKIKKT